VPLRSLYKLNRILSQIVSRGNPQNACQRILIPIDNLQMKEVTLHKEIFLWIAAQFVNSNVDSTTSAIKDHNNAILNHLFSYCLFAVFAALNARTLWL
jgi:hypothetical protein